MNDHNLSRLNKAFRVLGCILVVIGGITVMIGLGRRGLGYYWFLVAPLFGIAFYMLAPRSWRITRVLMGWFPVAKELIHRQEQVDYNISVVEKLGYTLKFYELCDLDQVADLRNGLINSLPDLNTEDARLENSARHAADYLKASNPNLPYRLLMLLYQDHHSSPPIVLWKDERTNLIPGLAKILCTSSHLQSRHYKVSFEQKDLELFLRPLEVFTLAAVKKEIEGLSELWSVIRDYHLFLIKHGVALEQPEPTPGEVLADLESNERPLDPDNLDKTLHRVLLAVGTASIGAAFSSLPEEQKRSFSLISLILFLEHKPSLRAIICREAGEDEAAFRITFAYLEFNEDLHTKVELDGKIFVSVAYLINTWAKKVEEKEHSLPGFQKEIDTIQQTLRQGKWITSLSYMIQRTLDTIKANSEVIMSGLDKIMAERPFVLESLKRVFGKSKTRDCRKIS